MWCRSPNLNNSTWEAVDSSANSTFWFELNDNPGKTDIIRDRMNFWDQFSHKQLKYEIQTKTCIEEHDVKELMVSYDLYY